MVPGGSALHGVLDVQFPAAAARLYVRTFERMTPRTIAVALVVAFSVGGICCLGIRQYEKVILSRSDYLNLPNPCHPMWLNAARSNTALPDAVIQEKLAGTWWRCGFASYDGDKLCMPLTLVSVSKDGHYDCHKGDTYRGIRTNVIQGHFHVKNGLIFDTITNYNFGHTNEQVRHLFSNQVVRVSDRELVYRSCPDGDSVVLFRKVKQAER